VSGRAITEGRLVVADDYRNFRYARPAFVDNVDDAVATAMGTPVSEDGVVVGTLVVASRRVGRAYDGREQDMLRSLAEHVSLALNDASARRAIERALSDAMHEATHDPLTGLPNRALVLDRLEHELARASRSGSHTAALFVDLDRFKVVNDSLGHGVGDEVLVEVARRLVAGARVADTVGRLAGDEFVVIAEDIDLEDALALGDRLAELVAAPMNLYGRETVLTASIGVALADGSASADEVLRDADVAMYRAKERGRARIELFDNAMRQRMLQRIDTEHALRQAIRDGDLRVHYQPVFSQQTGLATGVEALVRWQQADGRLVPPDQFIAVAEEAGLIIPLGAWVLRQACSDVAGWRRDHAALAHLSVAVNLSGRQFADAGLADAIANALSESGLPNDCLTLEITESVVMEEAEATISTLRSLKALGVHLAVDDFGTGYSSLSYLRRFPVDTLKIDRSFVSGLGDSSEDTAIVSAIITLAKALDLTVVAEGVETEAQLRALRQFGCDAAQGYLLGRPQSASDTVAALLAAHTAPANARHTFV
jgi:diguanylate cyclase (GGDEF)-like protein